MITLYIQADGLVARWQDARVRSLRDGRSPRPAPTRVVDSKEIWVLRGLLIKKKAMITAVQFYESMRSISS
jgi:hypothetical protein